MSVVKQTCVLTVWEHHSAASAARPEFFTHIQDETYVRQVGPYCAAASVAGLIASFAAELCPETARLEQATQSAIVSVYRDMKVPGLERSTARIGNLTWKRAMRTVAVPESEEEGALLCGQVRFAPRDFEPTSTVSEGSSTSDSLWERLCADMQAGVRFMYHCANHYTRLYGYRESLPGIRAGSLGLPIAGPGALADGAREEALGGDSDGEPECDSALEGEANRAIEEAIQFDWGMHRSSAGTRREVLTAKRGQGPKHWVSWEQVVADITKHRLHKLFAVTAVNRRTRERRARQKLANAASAAAGTAKPPAVAAPLRLASAAARNGDGGDSKLGVETAAHGRSANAWV